MNFKIISPLALAAALALSSAASAQTMIGDQEVSEENWALVETHCASLVANDQTISPEGTANEVGPATDMPAELPGDVLDLEQITVEDCRDAGLGV